VALLQRATRVFEQYGMIRFAAQAEALGATTNPRH
jgi:hypothetical protein